MPKEQVCDVSQLWFPGFLHVLSHIHGSSAACLYHYQRNRSHHGSKQCISVPSPLTASESHPTIAPGDHVHFMLYALQKAPVSPHEHQIKSCVGACALMVIPARPCTQAFLKSCLGTDLEIPEIRVWNIAAASRLPKSTAFLMLMQERFYAKARFHTRS